tara:strand:- start:127 stop:426 length:300 start_codon:yes stop_codon:yes gene_type:complete
MIIIRRKVHVPDVVYYITSTPPHHHTTQLPHQDAQPLRPSAKVKCKSDGALRQSAKVKWKSDVFRPKGRDKLCRSEAAPIIPQNAEKVKKNLQKKGLIS